MFGKFGYPRSPQKQLTTLVLETNKWLSQAAICKSIFPRFSQVLLGLSWGRSYENLYSFLVGRADRIPSYFPASWEKGLSLLGGHWAGAEAFMPLNFGRKLKATNMLKYVKTFLTVHKNAKNLQIFNGLWGKHCLNLIYDIYCTWVIYFSNNQTWRRFRS